MRNLDLLGSGILGFAACAHPTAFPPTLVAQTVKNLPAMQETRVQSLDREDPLDEEMVTHSSILVRRISRTEESGGLQSIGLQRFSDMTE